MRIICSAEASPENLFEVSQVPHKQNEEQRQLMDDLGITDVSIVPGGLSAGSTQSRQWRIELLCRYRRAKTSRITTLSIRKLYLYFVYFKQYVYFKAH